MTDSDKQRWDKRYAQGAYSERPMASALLQRFVPTLSCASGALALDIACGAGRNAIFLAEQGFRVQGWDISSVALDIAEQKALERGVTVDWQQVDLDTVSLPVNTYDLIVVTRFLNRELLSHMPMALTAGGSLIYEQHLVWPSADATEPTANTSVGGPKQAAYRFLPGELRDSFADLSLVYYNEGIQDDPDGTSMALAQLVATKTL